MSALPSHDVRSTLHIAMDLLPLNRAQHALIFNPDPEINSLAERIVALRHHGVPETLISQLMADVRRLLELNAQEGRGELDVAGQLDDLASAMAHAERNDQLVASASAKQVAAQLRRHLRVLREQRAAEHKDGIAYLTARQAIDDIVKSCPRRRLMSPTMINQLGAGPHRELVEMIGGRA